MHPATFENINPKRKVVVTYGKRNRLSRADEATPEPFLSDAPQPPRSSKGLDLTNIQNARLRRQPANEASVDNQSPESLPRVLGKRNTSAGSLVQSYALMTVSDQTRDSLPSPSKRKRIGPKRDDRDIYEFPEEEDEATMQVDIMLPRYRSKSQKASSHTSPPKPEPEPNVARKSPHIISRRKTASPAFSDVENPWAPPKPSSRGSVSTSRNPAPPPTDHGDGALKPSRPKQPPATATTNPPSITYADATKPLPRSPRSRRTMSPTSDGEYDRTTFPPRSPKSTRARPKPAFELMDIASSRRPKPHRRIQNMAVELPIGATIPTDDAQLDASNPSSPGSNSTSGSHEPTDRSSTPVFQKSMSDNAAASPPQLPPQVLPAFRKTTTSDTVTTIAGRTSRESSLWYMFDNASSSSSGAEAPRTVRSSAKRPAAPARRPNLVARMIQNQNQVQSAPPDDRAERNLFSIIETTSSPTSSPSTPVSASSSSQLPIQSVPTPSPDSDLASSDPPPPPSIAPAHRKPVPKRTFGRSVSSVDMLSDMVPPSVRRWNSEAGVMPVDEEIEPPPVLLAPTSPAPPTSPGRQRYVPQNHGGVRVTYGRSRSFLGQGTPGTEREGMMLETEEWLASNMRDEGLSESEDEDEAVDVVVGKKKDLKSVHELREAGEYKRFSDEMEYILDGLRENQGINIKRSSCIDLARKLLNTEFTMRLRAHNFIPRIYQGLRVENDPIIRCCLAFMIVVLVQDKRNVELLMMEDEFLDVVVALLDAETADPLCLRDVARVVKKKGDRFLVEDMKKIVFSSTLFDDNVEITVKRMGIRSLSAILSKRTRYEDFAKDKLRTAGGLRRVVESLLDAAKCVPARLTAYEGGEALIIESAPVDFALLGHCLLILEASSMQHVANTMEVAAIEGLFRRLLDFLLFCQVEAYNDNSDNAAAAMSCLEATIRVLVNLTHENPDGYREVGRPPGMATLLRVANAGYRRNRIKERSGGTAAKRREEDEEAGGVKFDALLLMVGLLINLVEKDAGNRDEFRRTEQSLTCQGAKRCLRRCRCADRQPAVCWLADMYRQQDATKGDMAPTESNAITAYMAMLLGFLVKDNRENEQLLLTRLPNGSVSSLIVILERFVQLTREIEDAEREESAATATIAGGPAHGGIDAMLMMLEGRPDVDKVEMMEEVLMATAPVTTLELQERSPVDSLSELVEELKEIERRNRADEGERVRTRRRM